MSAPWETQSSAPAPTPAPAPTASAPGSSAPWETPGAPQQKETTGLTTIEQVAQAAKAQGVSTQHYVDQLKLGGYNVQVAADNPTGAAHLPEYGALALNNKEQAKNFDYSTSPLRHIMSEDQARSLVQASFRQDGASESKTTAQQNMVLGLVPHKVLDMIDTAPQALITKLSGGSPTWDQQATEHRAEMNASMKAHPVAAGIGQAAGALELTGLAAAAPEAAAPGATAEIAAAATRVAKFVKPAWDVVKPVVQGAGAIGIAKHFGWLEHLMGE